MPKPIQFEVDYRGVLTDEEFYRAGDVAELPQASALVSAGRAEYAHPGPDKAEDLDALNVRQLRGMAKAVGIPKWPGMKKDELVEQLRENNES